MRIAKIEVSNLRALRNSELSFSDCTALIGENNSGKSAFLLALDLFFSSSPHVKPKDFSDGELEKPIDITIHFRDLTPSEEKEFSSNLVDESLIVTRTLLSSNSKDSGKFFVTAKVNPAFSDCRNEDGKSEKRDKYKELQKKYGLPNVKSADEIDGYLEEWESKNQKGLELKKVSGFKGWKNVAIGKLKAKTDYVFIRAVEDANENIQSDKNSPVRNLINTIARPTIENSAEFKEFIDGANKKILELTDPKQVPILAEISKDLTGILEGYYKESGIIATWDPVSQIQPSFPMANIEVRSNDFVTGIDGVGHGLQRAVILTVLQFMAQHRAKGESISEFKQAESDIIIAIEEPEIYQHPTKQRLFAKLLGKLAAGFSKETGIRIQVVYVTHSPLLVSLSDCHSIRMVRHISSGSGKSVTVREIDLQDCAVKSAVISGRKPEQAWSATQFAAKLHTFRSELAEGFFGKCVVLVEGVGDKAILEAWYRIADRDPHAEGIVIVDVTGKNNLDKPALIFGALGIPCYWVFDNDRDDGPGKKGSVEANMRLQRLAGIDEKKCVEWPEGVYQNFAAWNFKLEEYVKGKIGKAEYEKYQNEISIEFDIDSDMCLKFPASASSMLFKSTKDGKRFPELESIILAVDKYL